MTNPPHVVSSRVKWLITIVLSLTGALAHATTCDVDADGDIDRKDYLAILADSGGERASGPNDPRDLSNDAQLCARRCTLPLCDIPTNKAPIARNDAATTALDTRVRINVIANDRDRDGRIVPRTVKIVTKPKHGKVTRHRDGTVTYKPALGFRGRDRFGYRVKDNDGARSNAARVRMTVESGNGLPMADAGPDFNAATGALVTLDGSNSSDPDGDPLTFSWQFLSVPPASTVTSASLANSATAAPSFTTDVDGPYELAIEVADGQMTDLDTVTVTAATPNVPPNAEAGPDQSAVIGQIVDLDGQQSSDPDAGPSPFAFRWFFVAVPPGSMLTDANITGAATALASFAPDVAGAFRVGLEADDGADTDQDEVVVTVSPPNVAPNANAGTDIVVQLGPPAQTATLDATASNDPDNGPSPLSFLWTFVSVPPGSAITGADLSGAATATPSFTPDVAGQYLLRLDVTDGDLTDTDQVLVRANVAPNAADDSYTLVENTALTEPAPVAVNDTYTTDEDIPLFVPALGVLGNDTDFESDPLTAVVDTAPANGTLMVNADGSFTYTPNPDFNGTDTFTYHANDGIEDSNMATVSITVDAVNDVPPFTVGPDQTVLEDAGAQTAASIVSAATVNGLLTVDRTNRRYFTNKSGKAIYLSGSHTWTNIQNRGTIDPPRVFDYTAHLNWLASLNHNYTRLWMWESAYGLPRGQDWWFSPMYYKRTGPGNALDGKLKFDLNQFEQSTFDRLLSRVTAAQSKGLYVSVMFFEGFSISKKGKIGPNVGNPWVGHPYNGRNNINGINGDTNGNGEGEEMHKLPISAAIGNRQKAFVRKVIDTLNHLDNVIWEIVNEDVYSTGNRDWQYDMIRHIKSYEAGKPKQHLVGMTFQFPGGSNAALLNSPADWISPGGGGVTNPPAATGSKIILNDNDHNAPFAGYAGDLWVWRSFTRGLHPILMDDPAGQLIPANTVFLVKARKAMGDTIRYANKVDLRSLTPQNRLSSTAYCLCKAGSEYIAFKPTGGRSSFSVTPLAFGTYTVEWFNVTTRATTAAANVTGTGANKSFIPPFSGPAILYLKRVGS